MSDGWFAVQGHIVGNPEKWSMCYHDEGGRHRTREAAIKAGFRAFDTDDFNVGREHNGVLVEFGWMNDMFGAEDVAAEAEALGLSAAPSKANAAARP